MKTAYRGIDSMVVRILRQKPLRELRRMQAIVLAQIPMAFQQKNRKALAELQTREKEIAEAINLKVFG